MTSKKRALWITLALAFALQAAQGCHIVPQALTSPYSDYSRVPYHIEIAPSGLIFVATGGSYYQGVVWVLDPSSRNRMRPIKELAGEHVGSTTDLVLGPDGNVYALTLEGGIWLIDGTTGKPRLFKEGLFTHMAFTPSGDHILLTRGFGPAVSTVEMTDSKGYHQRYVHHNLFGVESIVVTSGQEAYLVGFKGREGPAYIDVLSLPEGETVKEIELDAGTLQGYSILGAGVSLTGEVYLLTRQGLHFVEINRGELIAVVPIVDPDSIDSDSDGLLYVTVSMLGNDWDHVYVIDPRTHTSMTTWRVYLEPRNLLQPMIAVDDGKGYLGIPGKIVVYDLKEGGVVEVIEID